MSRPGWLTRAALRVGVRKVPGGVFSTWVNERLQPGDTLEVYPPQGHFTVPLDAAARRHVVGIAGGAEKCAHIVDELGFDGYSRSAIENREQAIAWLAFDHPHLEPADVTVDVTVDGIAASNRISALSMSRCNAASTTSPVGMSIPNAASRSPVTVTYTDMGGHRLPGQARPSSASSAAMRSALFPSPETRDSSSRPSLRALTMHSSATRLATAPA